MSYITDLRGIIKINGENEGGKIFARYSDHCISVGCGRKSLTLDTFNTNMVINFNYTALRNDVEYAIQGANVGNFKEGPTGHPGDNEYDYRTITKIILKIEYYNNSLIFRLNGTACAPNEEKGFLKKRLDDWIFEIWFKIPKNNLKVFLELSDGEFSALEKELLHCNAGFNFSNYV